MGAVMIVSAAKDTAASLAGLLKAALPGPVVQLGSGAAARRKIAEGECEMLLVNTPLPDEFGDELARFAQQKTATSAILIVKSEMADEIAAKVEDDGIMVLAKPVSKTLFFQAVKLASITRRQLLHMQKENEKLQNRIEELRLVDRAKCALIQYRGLTEMQAHKLIEKEAMDSRQPRKEIAKEILRTFEGEP